MSKQHYILPMHFVDSLRSIRKDFEKAKGIEDLDKEAPPYAVSRMVGYATDVDARRLQIMLLEALLQMVDPYLQKIEDDHSEETILNYFYALKVLVEASLFVKSEISGSGSQLVKLLDKAMGINSDNQMDEKTRLSTLLATEDFLKKHKLADNFYQKKQGPDEQKTASASFKKLQAKFKLFKTRVSEQCDKLNTSGFNLNNFPITRFTMRAFSLPPQLFGYSTGYIIGDMLLKLAPFQSTRNNFTQAVGTGVTAWFFPGSLGSLYMAPIWAGRMLDAYSGISLAWIMGTMLGLLGKGVGFGVGIGLDLSWKLAKKPFKMAYKSYYGTEAESVESGFRLVDGQLMAHGREFKVVNTDELPDRDYKDYIKFENDEIHICINGEKVTVNEEFLNTAERERPEIVLEIQKMLHAQQPEITALDSNNNNNNTPSHSPSKPLAPFFGELQKSLKERNEKKNSRTEEQKNNVQRDYDTHAKLG